MSNEAGGSDLGCASENAVALGVIGAFEAAFPGRVRGYYLFGSQMDGSAVAGSDVDLFVVFKDDFVAGEAERAQILTREWAERDGRRCDLLPVAERRMVAEGHFRLKSASRLIYGAEMRDRMPPVTLDAYLRNYTEAPYASMAQVMRRTDRLVAPLTYPDLDGPFYGYDTDDSRPGAAGERSIKGLVSAVCWAATIMSGFAAGRMVGTKAESVIAYRDSVGDHWAPFVETLYAHGKTAWGYRIPENAADRALLRDLCRETLAFENHYLAQYRAYLLAHLRAPDAARIRFAVARLGTVLFADAEVSDALHTIAASAPTDLRDAARETLHLIEHAHGSHNSPA